MKLPQHCRDFWRIEDGPLEKAGVELPVQLAAVPDARIGPRFCIREAP